MVKVEEKKEATDELLVEMGMQREHRREGAGGGDHREGEGGPGRRGARIQQQARRSCDKASRRWSRGGGRDCLDQGMLGS